jgi:hypothetical protein
MHLSKLGLLFVSFPQGRYAKEMEGYTVPEEFKGFFLHRIELNGVQVNLQ